ncbi:MAG: HlyD family secretion protein [Flavipsychrobacter sp.]|nr:HlyD family secretion protein [Flavipsychrobacter sp.]
MWKQMSGNEKLPKRKLSRRGLMAGGIAVVFVVSTFFYLTAGRYIYTDNAYVKSAKILVTPQVTGEILSVYVADNQLVKAGDTIFDIDPNDYQISVDEAQADLEISYVDIEQIKAQYRQKREDLSRAQVDVDFAKDEYNRRVDLAESGGVSQTEFKETKRKRDAAEKTAAVLTHEVNGILVALDNNPDLDPKDHPHYRRALAKLKDAQLNLQRTKVKAATDGIIGTAPHVGDYAKAGVPALNLVGSKDIWIEANYKETELTEVKPGQLVTIEVDTYPGRKWSGRVESISPASGSEFSVLPAQNATGNWVKVVQRIAVRIAVDEKSKAFPLRVGMSAHVTIDIGHYPHMLFHTAYTPDQ